MLISSKRRFSAQKASASALARWWRSAVNIYVFGHLNNCATGVATQDDKLRKNHYHGLPFKVTNYFEFIARETRELMAQLGVTRLVDLIGRTDLLKELDGFTAKQQKLALSKLLETAEPHPGKALYCTENNPPFDNGLLNAQLLQQAKTVCR